MMRAVSKSLKFTAATVRVAAGDATFQSKGPTKALVRCMRAVCTPSLYTPTSEYLSTAAHGANIPGTTVQCGRPLSNVYDTRDENISPEGRRRDDNMRAAAQWRERNNLAPLPVLAPRKFPVHGLKVCRFCPGARFVKRDPNSSHTHARLVMDEWADGSRPLGFRRWTELTPAEFAQRVEDRRVAEENWTLPSARLWRPPD